MTTNLPDNISEPADLSQLAATDALLDRLGGRNVGDDDLEDSAVAALFQLVTFIDESREPDLGLGRLVEVLAGRPLYVTAPEEAADSSELEDVDGNRVRTARAGARVSPESRRVIDLTDHGRSDLAVIEKPDTDDLDHDLAVAAFGVRSIRSGAGSKKNSARSGSAAGRRWEQVLSHASLPAAAVLLLLVLGSGVSAAVTGNPMTPVNGVSRVMAQLPGVDNSQRTLAHVRGEITAATVAMSRNDGVGANRHLAEARRDLDDVPDSNKPDLAIAIANVQLALNDPTTSPISRGPGDVGSTPIPGDGSGSVPGAGTGSGAGSGSGAGTGGVAAGTGTVPVIGATTTPPVAAPATGPPVATSAPVTSAPVVATSAPPSVPTSPSTAPTTPETKVTTAAAPVESTPAVTASGSKAAPTGPKAAPSGS